MTAECRGINLLGSLHLCGVQNATSAKSGTIGNASLSFLTLSLKAQMLLGGARSVRRLSRKMKTNDRRFNEESITQRKLFQHSNFYFI